MLHEYAADFCPLGRRAASGDLEAFVLSEV